MFVDVLLCNCSKKEKSWKKWNIPNYLTLVLFQAQESFNDFLRVSFSGCLNITFSETLMQMRQLWQQI
jgi:hypothetical protein